jgi:hypothetical protein
VLGKVKYHDWTGDDRGLGIVARLNADKHLKYALADARKLGIVAQTSFDCWLLYTRGWHVPTVQEWRCDELVAQHLLDIPLPRRRCWMRTSRQNQTKKPTG